MTRQAMRGLGPTKQHWPAANLNLLYALMDAQEDHDWRDIARERRSEVLMRLDDMGLAPK